MTAVDLAVYGADQMRDSVIKLNQLKEAIDKAIVAAQGAADLGRYANGAFNQAAGEVIGAGSGEGGRLAAQAGGMIGRSEEVHRRLAAATVSVAMAIAQAASTERDARAWAAELGK